MFAFNMPRFAAINVRLSTGCEAIMIHVGDGRFVTNIPPLILSGVSSVEGEVTSDLPVTWDSGALPVEFHSATFVFDAKGAAHAVEAAAAAGDADAKSVMGSLADAEKMLAAREKVGMVPASGWVQ